MINFKAERYARIRMGSVEEANEFVTQLTKYISAQGLLDDIFWAEMSMEVVGLSVVIGPTLAHVICAMMALGFMADIIDE